VLSFLSGARSTHSSRASFLRVQFWMAEDLGQWEGGCLGVSIHAYNSLSGLGYFPSELKVNLMLM